MSFRLALLVSASGVAAVGYELLWIRALSLHFGNTSQAIAAVVATFMAGLACGNAWLGRLADRQSRPLRLYRWLELIAGASGLAVSLFLLLAGAALDGLARVCAAAGSWSTLAMCAVLALWMLVPTTVMGGTLPVLSRALSKQAEPGRALARVYMWNTCGAVLGALLPDLVLIPSLGMVWTAVALAACNALVVWLLGPLLQAESSSIAPLPLPAAAPIARSELAALLLSAVTGFCALGLEVLWSRTLQAWAAALLTSFALLLALYLLALALGTWLGQRSSLRVRAPLTAAGWLCVAAAGGVLICVYAAPAFRDLALALWPRPAGLRRTGLGYEAVAALLHAGFLEGVPCLLLGAAFPFVAAAWLRPVQQGRAGSRTGWLFTVNTLAGVLGSLVTGFWWLPQLGEQASYVALALLLSTGAALCAWLGSWQASPVKEEHFGRSRAALGWCTVAALAVIGGAWAVPSQRLAAAHLTHQARAQAAGELLAVREGATTTAAAVAHYVYGERHYLELQTPGVSMSNTRLGARRYMAMLAHAGMLLGSHERRSALLICYGVGNTARALLDHATLQRLDVVDISPEVLSLAPEFAAHSGTAPLRDARTRVFVDDGRHHLITQDSVYDVITAEPPPPNHAGVVNLYTREFYQLAKRRLAPAGVITQWLPVFQLSDADIRSMIAAFVSELPHTLLLYGYQQQLILVGSRQPLLLANIEPDAALARALQDSGIVGVEDLVAAVLQTDAALRGSVQGSAPLDDLHPKIAYPFEAVPEAELFTQRFTYDPAQARSLVPADQAALLPRVAAASTAVQLALQALPWLERPRSEVRELALGRLLQPALDARANDEHIWSLLAADRDRVRLAEKALAAPRAQAPLKVRRAHYALLQDASWLLARRAFYARDYRRALALLDELTPEPGQRALHALLRAGSLRALGDAAGAAAAFRAAAAFSGDASFQRACRALADMARVPRLAEQAGSPAAGPGPW